MPGSRACVERDKDEDHSTHMGFLTLMKSLNLIMRGSWGAIEGNGMFSIDSLQRKEGLSRGHVNWSRSVQWGWGRGAVGVR